VPRYLQLLALLSLHAFIREGVEAAVFETHHGGEYDATNFIENTVVTVVTPLGMDHATQLGPTIRNIAWHKAGILKPGSLAFSAPPDHQETVEVLLQRAEEKGAPLRFVPSDDPELPRASIQLKPDVQRSNCSVALAAVRAWVDASCLEENPLEPVDIEKGLSQFSWPGRFQYMSYGGCDWFLDGAHNEMSVDKAAEWFIDMSRPLRYVPWYAPR
jgi:folylpolyglutamate synthase